MKKVPFHDRPYRKGVGVMLVNAEGLVFAGRRIDTTTEAWQMPQGGIDEGEDPRAAALRELYEEVGTRAAEIVAESAGWLTYDLPEHLADKVWKAHYRGQAQKWYLMRFTGGDDDIDIGGVDGHKPEFCEWRWVAPDALPGLIVGFKQALYARVVAEFDGALKTLRIGA